MPLDSMPTIVDEPDRQERRRMLARVDAALEHVQHVADELEELRLDLLDGEPLEPNAQP